VPCAFGTVLVSDADVEEELLSERREELQAALARLDGRVQHNVRASYDEEELLRELVAHSPDLGKLREESRRLGDAGYYQRVRLGELVAELLEQRRRENARSILSELSGIVDDVVVDDPGEYDALKASFLVPRKKLDRFDKKLEGVAKKLQPLVRIEVIGPLPPTAFASAR
jgi:hypothetical protein